MRHALLALKLLLLAYCGYLFFFLATAYDPAASVYRPPIAIFVLDTINLFIHEAGHFFFKPLGMWVYIFAGSFFQCLIPLALLITVWRENISHIPYPAFWLGENLVNVSAYIYDAPYRKLKLIARGLIHDWSWLLAGNLEYAKPLGDAAFFTGLALCAAALGAGVFFALRAFREDSGSVVVE